MAYRTTKAKLDVRVMDKRITKRMRRQRAVTIAQEFLAAAMLWVAVILLFILAG